MIIELKMYGCKCDKCGELWHDNNDMIASIDEVSIAAQVAEDDSWLIEIESNVKKHYCQKCWGYDEDGEITLRNQI